MYTNCMAKGQSEYLTGNSDQTIIEALRRIHVTPKFIQWIKERKKVTSINHTISETAAGGDARKEVCFFLL